MAGNTGDDRPASELAAKFVSELSSKCAACPNTASGDCGLVRAFLERSSANLGDVRGALDARLDAGDGPTGTDL